MPPRKTYYSNRKQNNRKNYGTTAKKSNTQGTNYACNSPKFKIAKTECEWRMGSYRNVYSQFNRTNSKTTFSPTAANKWTRYINSGARVYKFSTTDFTKFFGQQWKNWTPTTAKQYMKKKFGPAIKDVTRGNNNCWLVATTKTVTGRPFTNYTWK